MTRWGVMECDGMWMGQIGMASIECSPTSAIYQPPRYIRIMPTSFPYEMAVDALLDFMDRLRTGRVPEGVTEPLDLMALCVAATRRQR